MSQHRISHFEGCGGVGCKEVLDFIARMHVKASRSLVAGFNELLGTLAYRL